MLKGVNAFIVAAAGRISMGSPVHRLDDFLPEFEGAFRTLGFGLGTDRDQLPCPRRVDGAFIRRHAQG
jgi:hypothetical protein